MIDFKEELRLFLAAVKFNRPSPCPNPEQCDNYSCDANRSIIVAYERAEKALSESSI